MCAYDFENYTLERVDAERIIKKLDGTINYIVESHFPTYFREHRDDMYSESILAVLGKLCTYDESVSKPTTYFSPYILHAMNDYIAKLTNNTSKYYSIITGHVRKAMAKCEANNIDANEETLAFLTGYTIEQVKNALTVIDRNNTCDIYEENVAVDSFDDEIEEKILLEEICSIVDDLDPDFRIAVKMHYGIGCDPASERAISKKLNVSVRQVRNRLDKGIDTIKRKIGAV